MELNVQDWKEFLLNSICKIEMGNKFDNDKMEHDNPSVNFVSRTANNNGVSDCVDYIEGVTPYPSGTLSVALGGSIGSCYLQSKPFYTGQNVCVLKFDDSISDLTKLFIASLFMNECKYKFVAFGRELNKHMKTDFSLFLPILKDENGNPVVDIKHKYSDDGFIPDWQFMEDYMKSLHSEPITTKVKGDNIPELNVQDWEEFILHDVFDLKGGFYNKKPEHSEKGSFPFLASTESNNGVTEYYSIDDIKAWNKVGNQDNSLEKKIYSGNCIAVTVNGSVCNAFYQLSEFTCSHDITALYLKNDMLNVYIATFLCSIIMIDKYRWNYGRKPHNVKKFGNSVIKLPIQRDNQNNSIIDTKHKYSEKGYIPDWKFMENYIKSLPYSDRICVKSGSS